MWLWKQTRSFAAGGVVGSLFVATGVAVYSKVPDISTRTELRQENLSVPAGVPKIVPALPRPEPGQGRNGDVVLRQTEQDRARIAFQKICPGCREELAAKKPLGRVELTVYVCGRQCIAGFDKAPPRYDRSMGGLLCGEREGC